MHSDTDIDGIDFRPFFDMVVGILFVLLILIGALLFFQQAAQNQSDAREAEREAQLLQLQSAKFLQTLAEHLRQHGFAPQIDLIGRSVSLPLANLASVAASGVPDIAAQRIEDLGHLLAGDLQCLTGAAQGTDVCASYDRLRLNLASLRVGTGNLVGATALPQAQFGRLLTSEVTTALFRSTPALLTLSNPAGDTAIEVAGRVSTAPPPSGSDIGGEVEIHLDFVQP